MALQETTNLDHEYLSLLQDMIHHIAGHQDSFFVWSEKKLTSFPGYGIVHPTKSDDWECDVCRHKPCQHIKRVEAALKDDDDDITEALSAAINRVWKTRNKYVPATMSQKRIPLQPAPHFMKQNRKSLSDHMKFDKDELSCMLSPSLDKMCQCGHIFDDRLLAEWLFMDGFAYTLNDILHVKGKVTTQR